MLTGTRAQQRRRPGPPETMSRGQNGRGRGRGGNGRQPTRQVRAPNQAMPPSGAVSAGPPKPQGTGASARPPSLGQITVVQAQNLSSLKEMVEDLAKGVLQLSKVVGQHTGQLEDFKSRIQSIETELGAEIDYTEGDYDEADNNDELPGDTDEIGDDDDEPDTSNNA